MSSPRRVCRAFLVGTLVFGPTSSRAADPPEAPGCAPAGDVRTRVFLVGDAGAPDRRREPVLQALHREASRAPGHSVVMFLGDNVYPSGLAPLPPSSGAPRDKARLEGERVLDALIAAVPDRARGILVPGNHDWDGDSRFGWDAVRRQDQYVTARGAPRVRFVPQGGCPGPRVLDDLGENLRVVALDTQWWLHSGPKPLDPGSECGADSPGEVLRGLRAALETAGGRKVIVAGHHPLLSGGPHGGVFGLKEHVFPLTEKVKWLWLPLPGIGSLYPLARRAGVSVQDLSNETNTTMREALASVLRERPPLAYASGHEHTLQVLEKPEWARLLLVSGTGIYDHTSPVRDLPETRFAASASGFMRLELTASGRARLGVLVVDERGETKEPYCRWVD